MQCEASIQLLSQQLIAPPPDSWDGSFELLLGPFLHNFGGFSMFFRCFYRLSSSFFRVDNAEERRATQGGEGGTARGQRELQMRVWRLSRLFTCFQPFKGAFRLLFACFSPAFQLLFSCFSAAFQLLFLHFDSEARPAAPSDGAPRGRPGPRSQRVVRAAAGGAQKVLWSHGRRCGEPMRPTRRPT